MLPELRQSPQFRPAELISVGSTLHGVSSRKAGLVLELLGNGLVLPQAIKNTHDLVNRLIQIDTGELGNCIAMGVPIEEILDLNGRLVSQTSLPSVTRTRLLNQYTSAPHRVIAAQNTSIPIKAFLETQINQGGQNRVNLEEELRNVTTIGGYWGMLRDLPEGDLNLILCSQELPEDALIWPKAAKAYHLFGNIAMLSDVGCPNKYLELFNQSEADEVVARIQEEAKII
ncbi:hypothetical protein JW978_01510 [Candidatus Dojkabacteria bacterium]|nr:hypothetical protein [Candidatus Dojkabacteria bacterium]